MGSRSPKFSRLWAGLAALLGAASCLAAPALEVFFPLERTAYRTDERIHLAVLRTDTADLPATELTLQLSEPAGSNVTVVFPVAAAAAVGGQASQTLHYYLKGSLLRPADYQVRVDCGEATARSRLSVRSHLPESSFVTLHWGSRARGRQFAASGEDSLGFNTILGQSDGDSAVVGGIDWMVCCSIGGGHQLNLRLDCDWSDPYAILSGLGGKAAQVALAQLRSGAARQGVHLYDEPGLTWRKLPEGGMTPHGVEAQVRAFRAAFGKDWPDYTKVDPDNPADVQAWRHWGRWKLGFMEAAWRLARWHVEEVDPGLLTLTQSQYGWGAFTDGYYFNVARSLPLLSGHGGYDDLGQSYLTPGLTYVMGRAREYYKPAWYLPGWYADLSPDRFRLEQYLTFMEGVQGLATPPPVPAYTPSQAWATQGVVASNQELLKLGPIANSMIEPTHPPVGMLWSMSQNLHAQTRDMSDNYAGGGHVDSLRMLHVAAKLTQVGIQPVVEEDVLDGTLARRHRVLVVSKVDYLPPDVVTALEQYLEDGGEVLLTADSGVEIRGARKLEHVARNQAEDKVAELMAEGRVTEAQAFRTAGWVYESVAPLAKELSAHYERLNIRPIARTSEPQVLAGRQVQGDVEYIFVVNAAFDEVYWLNPKRGKALKPVTSMVALANDGRPVYDALSGELLEFAEKGHEIQATFRFGPGQWRVFARPAQPITGVQVLVPELRVDFTREQPLELSLKALVTAGDRVLSGAVPLEWTITDPLRRERFHFYRATDHGVCDLVVPLAVNDPVGEYQVQVKELLSGKTYTTSFTFRPAGQAGAVAGAPYRSVMRDGDWQRIYDFFRRARTISVVIGDNAAYRPAAQRLADSLKPWDIGVTIVEAKNVRPRDLSAEEAATFTRLTAHTPVDSIKPGRGNNPTQVGWEVDGPTLLIGTPEDNPLIDALALAPRARFPVMPWPTAADRFPGRGVPALVWARDTIRKNNETLALVAYDEAALAEGVGHLYELCAGMKPLTAWQLPRRSRIAQADIPLATEGFQVAYATPLADRVDELIQTPRGTLLLSNDGTLQLRAANGAVIWSRTFEGGEHWALAASAGGDLIALSTQHQVLLLNQSGDVQHQLAFTRSNYNPGVSALAVNARGTGVMVATEDGRRILYNADGEELWQVADVSREDELAHAKAVATFKARADEVARLTKEYEAAMQAWKDAGKPKDKRPQRPDIDAPKPLQPESTATVAFSPDGRYVMAVAGKTLTVHDMLDGSVVTSLDGFAPPHAHGPSYLRFHSIANELLLGNLQRYSIQRFSPVQAKVVGELQLGNRKEAGASWALPFGDGILVVDEGSYTLHLVNAIDGKLADQVLWQHEVPGRIPKDVYARTDRLAVLYWGGLVQVLDPVGQVVIEQQFDTDIVDLVWTGEGALTAGFADGRVATLRF